MVFGKPHIEALHEPWNKGKLIGQKRPLTPQQIWSIRMRLQAAGNLRDLALFNLGSDSRLRACDLLRLRVSDVAAGDNVQSRATIRQRKTKRPVPLCRNFSAKERESGCTGDLPSQPNLEMLTETSVAALPADQDLADFVWEAWNSGIIQNDHTRSAWLYLASESECDIFCGTTENLRSVLPIKTDTSVK